MNTSKVRGARGRRAGRLSTMAVAACAGLAAPAGRAAAQQGGPAWSGEMGITETVQQIMQRPSAPPPFPTLYEADEREEPDRGGLPQDPLSPAVPRWPYERNDRRHGLPLPAVYPLVGPEDALDNPQTIGTNVLSITSAESGFIPPDSQVAIGPTQIVAFANGRIKTFNRAGSPDGALNTSANSFFTSVRNGSTVSDPQVRFDRISQRWFLLGINTPSTSNRVVLAVSSGPTITNTSSFTFFFFQQDTVSPVGNSGQFADYPSLGVDANALYTGSNMFGGGFVGTTGWVIQKASVLGAGPIGVTAFRGIGTTSSGVYSPRGVDNDDPAATEGYFIGTDVGSLGRLVMRRVSNPGGSPTISSNILITVATTAKPISVPAMGSTISMDALDDRLFAATVHRDRLTGVTTLVTSHNIQVNSSGVASSSGGRNGSRWYQLGNLTGTPNVVQSGTLFDNAASSPLSYWIPTAAMSGQGHLAVACSRAGAGAWAGAATAGRLSTDVPGLTQAPTIIVNGGGSYTVTGGDTRNRWGDYSATMVDPLDDQTLWTVQEYVTSTNAWGLRVAKLLAPPPVTPTSASPAVAAGDTNVNVTVTGAQSAGSAFYDTAAGYNRIQAAVNGGGVTVNSVARNSNTQLTLNVSVASNAVPGTRTITVTNPDGQAATSAAIFTVNSGSPVCPSFSQQPTGASVCVGDFFSLTVDATGQPAPTYQWRRNNQDIPGATDPTYGVLSATTNDGGTYTCIATNACGSTPSNPAVVTVTAAPTITGQPSSQTVPMGAPASFSVTAPGATSYQWFHDNEAVSGATSATYSIASVVASDAGSYLCQVDNDCGQAQSSTVTLTIGGAPCYANCDSSTADPFLNVADFTCFLQRYASADPYANCDSSTTAPALNVADFTCFLQKYAAGCSAP
jgi:hypothetical protein